jgi:hypothetical protein
VIDLIGALSKTRRQICLILNGRSRQGNRTVGGITMSLPEIHPTTLADPTSSLSLRPATTTQSSDMTVMTLFVQSAPTTCSAFPGPASDPVGGFGSYTSAFLPENLIRRSDVSGRFSSQLSWTSRLEKSLKQRRKDRGRPAKPSQSARQPVAPGRSLKTAHGRTGSF